jgi:predicted transcriptional regulator
MHRRDDMPSFATPVSSFMTAPVQSVRASERLRKAYDALKGYRISSLAVVDDRGRPIGVITRTDLIRVGRFDTGRRPKSASLVLPDKPVSDAMTPRLESVEPSTTVREAAKKMIEAHIHRVFVIEDDTLAGVLSTKDVMVAISEEPLAMPIADLMSSPVFTVRAEEPLSLATERLERAHVSGLVVVEEGWPVGVFTQSESLLSADLPRDTPIESVMSPAMLCLGVQTPVHRAAAQAAATRARRVIATEARQVMGILTGIDFARATQASSDRSSRK